MSESSKSVSEPLGQVQAEPTGLPSNQGKWAIRSRRVLRSKGFESAALLIEAGQISKIVAFDKVPSAYDLEDVGDLIVMPGVVDSHVHINEPGRTEWEGFTTATRAAAAGGITTLADMPLNCIPVTTSAEAFREKLKHIEGRLSVDLCFWGGVVPGNSAELNKMMDLGVMGFKCFLIHSGIDDFPNVERHDLELVMPILAKRGLPLLVHAELDCSHNSDGTHIDSSHSDQSKLDSDFAAAPHKYSNFLTSRPRSWENEAIKLMIDLCREFDCRVHIVHLSSSDALPMIAAAKKEGLKLTVETCPHYLTLVAEDIADGDTRFKCTPPIRERENCEKLWQGLADGTIDFIVSDHSPCTPELKLLKEGNFDKAWGGISSLQFGLSAVWSEAKKRGHSLAQVSEWMSKRPAQFLGLAKRKGSLEEGMDADIVVFDSEKSFKIEQSMIEHRHKVTPHEGRIFTGQVQQTFVRGIKVYDQGNFSKEPSGKALMGTKSGEYVDANVHS